MGLQATNSDHTISISALKRFHLTSLHCCAKSKLDGRASRNDANILVQSCARLYGDKDSD